MSIVDDLASMSDALNSLVPKEDGNLVRSDDWNSLVGQMLTLGTIVSTQQENYEDNIIRISAVEARLTELDAQVDAIANLIGESGDGDETILSRLEDVEETKLEKETFAQYQATLDPLLLQYTVTLETDDVSYLLGEVATLTATVRRLDNSAVTTRPWLDFLVSWGDVQAVSGFETRPGAGGRSVSVRTNSAGIARVRIKAENLAQTSDTTDIEMQAFFATEISSQNQTRVMRQAIMEAANPQDNFMAVMYATTTQRYDSGSLGIQIVTDQYYQGRFFGAASDLFFPTGSWRDYRATIAVFAKDDSNPETPDFGKGVSSIQINFRDWIGPWIVDYEPDIPYLEGPWVVDIPDIILDPDYRPELLIDYFDERITGLGLLGKHKALESMAAVIGQVGDSQINPGAGPLINVIGDAVKTQKNMDFFSYGDAATQGRELTALSQAVQQAAGTGVVQDQVQSVETQVASIDSKATSLETSYSMLNGRVNETTVQGESLMLALSSIDNKVGNINIVDADSVRGSVSAIKADIAALRINLQQ